MPRYRDRALEDGLTVCDNSAAPWMIGALRNQIDRGFRWLQFGSALEREFCLYLNLSARMNRLALLLIGSVTLLVAPVFNDLLLGVADGAEASVGLIQYGVMHPVLALSFLWCLFRSDSLATEWVMTGQFVVTTVGLLINRVVLAKVGADFPIEFVGVSLAVGLLAMGNISTAIITFIFAYLFGFLLTVGPMLQGGSDDKPQVIRDAFKSETASIVVMEVVAISVDLWLAGGAGMHQPLFWNSLIISLSLGLLAAWPVNVWLVKHGVKGGMADPRETDPQAQHHAHC